MTNPGSTPRGPPDRAFRPLKHTFSTRSNTVLTEIGPGRNRGARIPTARLSRCSSSIRARRACSCKRKERTWVERPSSSSGRPNRRSGGSCTDRVRQRPPPPCPAQAQATSLAAHEGHTSSSSSRSPLSAATDAPPAHHASISSRTISRMRAVSSISLKPSPHPTARNRSRQDRTRRHRGRPPSPAATAPRQPTGRPRPASSPDSPDRHRAATPDPHTMRGSRPARPAAQPARTRPHAASPLLPKQETVTLQCRHPTGPQVRQRAHGVRSGPLCWQCWPSTSGAIPRVTIRTAGCFPATVPTR